MPAFDLLGGPIMLRYDLVELRDGTVGNYKNVRDLLETVTKIRDDFPGLFQTMAANPDQAPEMLGISKGVVYHKDLAELFRLCVQPTKSENVRRDVANATWHSVFEMEKKEIYEFVSPFAYPGPEDLTKATDVFGHSVAKSSANNQPFHNGAMRPYAHSHPDLKASDLKPKVS